MCCQDREGGVIVGTCVAGETARVGVVVDVLVKRECNQLSCDHKECTPLVSDCDGEIFAGGAARSCGKMVVLITPDRGWFLWFGREELISNVVVVVVRDGANWLICVSDGRRAGGWVVKMALEEQFWVLLVRSLMKEWGYPTGQL